MSEVEELYYRRLILGSITADCVGSTVWLLAGHPFDTVKVRLQTAKPGVYKGAYDCLLRTVNKEGFFALFKGMAAPFVSVTPVVFSMFAGQTIALSMLEKDSSECSLSEVFQTGALAGCFATIFMAPSERIKCLLQVQTSASAENQFKGVIDCVRQLYKEGGIARSLYKGTGATLLRDVPGCGVYLSSYEFLRRSMSDNNDNLSFPRLFLSAILASAAQWCFVIPADVVKTRLQAVPVGAYPDTIITAAKQLLRNEGPLGFYKGFVPVMLRTIPANVACLIGYECVRKAFPVPDLGPTS